MKYSFQNATNEMKFLTHTSLFSEISVEMVYHSLAFGLFMALPQFNKFPLRRVK